MRVLTTVCDGWSREALVCVTLINRNVQTCVCVCVCARESCRWGVFRGLLYWYTQKLIRLISMSGTGLGFVGSKERHAVCCSALQSVAVRCSLLQSVAVRWCALQHVAVRFGSEEGSTVCCSALQFVAAWCVAAFLQCDAAGFGV